jgi:hypothetical protein
LPRVCAGSVGRRSRKLYSVPTPTLRGICRAGRAQTEPTADVQAVRNPRQSAVDVLVCERLAKDPQRTRSISHSALTNAVISFST